VADNRTNWDPETMGHGKHTYRHINPETINPEDYARNLRGEEQHFGDIREYNAGYNEKHPENDLDLDWLGRTGTIFETEAEGFAGLWHVTNMPAVKAPDVFCRAVKISNPDEPPEGKEEVTIPCVALGVAVGQDNKYLQVKSRLLKKGAVDKAQRIKLTKKQ